VVPSEKKKKREKPSPRATLKKKKKGPPTASNHFPKGKKGGGGEGPLLRGNCSSRGEKGGVDHKEKGKKLLGKQPQGDTLGKEKSKKKEGN